MQDLGNVLDLPSPANSLHYVYGKPEQYFSESQSPGSSAYDLTSAAETSNVPSRHPSPGCEEEESAQLGQQQNPAAKRKRENRYKNAPPAVLSRRRAQNRASQRAYRERKDQRIKDLEQMLTDAQQRNDVLRQAYATLHAEYVALNASSQLDDRHTYHMPYGGGGVPVMVGGLDAGATHGLVDGGGMDLFVYGARDMNTGYSL